MDDIERIKEAKRKRLAAEQDARIRKVAKLVGADHRPWCMYCGEPTALTEHAPDCQLSRLRSDVLIQAKQDANKQLRKEANRQRIFKSDKPHWNGLPRMGKTLVKKRRSKNRGPAREILFCDVCIKKTLWENGRCSKCKHKYPCPEGSNCSTCN